MTEDGSVGGTAWLPRDVLAGILVRLPTSDLRRFRRVCKEWREVMDDPAFIDEHIDHGPRTQTNTILFFSGCSPAYKAKFPDSRPVLDGNQTHNGRGYLMDEQWRVTARFTVGEAEDMVGVCNGLLCFLDVLRDAINIVEPFTGESITLPLPPKTGRGHNHHGYCFGFDPSSRRYKLLYLSGWERVNELYVYTVGEGTSWRSVGAAPGVSYGDLMIIDGAVYWCARGKNSVTRLRRFDLAKEEVTSELIEFRPQTNQTLVFFYLLGCLDGRVCLMTSGMQKNVLLIGEGARWANSRTVTLPRGQLNLTLPQQPLNRGHLLIQEYWNGDLYAHPIASASCDLGSGNLLLQMATTWEDACKVGDTDSMSVTPRCNTRGLFVPVPAGQVRRVPHKASTAKTFCYAPPVSPAPLAHYFGKLSEFAQTINAEIATGLLYLSLFSLFNILILNTT